MPTNSSPLISICIPTYNRAWYLEKTLDCLTSQRIFQKTSLVEICVSDNASEDDTPAVVRCYQRRFGSKIIYSRNATNICDQNFEKALSLGHGDFLKLCNDTAWYNPGMLEVMLHHVERWLKERPLLFFKEAKNRKGTQELLSLDTFADAVSYYMCNSNSFGIWKDDFDSLSNFSRFSSRRFAHTDAFLRLMAVRRRALLIRDDFFISVWPPSKGGYNFAQVFGDNYIGILKENGISPAALRREQIRSLRHIVRYYFDPHDHYRFLKTGYLPYMQCYRTLPQFWLSFVRVAKKHLLAILLRTFASKRSLFRRKWKNFNPFNKLEPANIFPLNQVQAGRYASGSLWVEARDGDAHLLIGDYVRFGQGVRFLCGSSPIRLGTAVRVGERSIIKSGATLGEGALIEAGSVVEGNIPAWAIASGCPAKVTGWRFSQKMRDEMKTFSFSSIPPESMNFDPDILLKKAKEADRLAPMEKEAR
ncbi:MAG: glycosyltransferase [Mailhella sp.]|nr:glycosyltransferase [Mailhella sp.]